MAQYDDSAGSSDGANMNYYLVKYSNEGLSLFKEEEWKSYQAVAAVKKDLIFYFEDGNHNVEEVSYKSAADLLAKMNVKKITQTQYEKFISLGLLDFGKFPHLAEAI